MEHHVLKIDSQIQQHQRAQKGYPPGKRQVVEQPPAPLLGCERHSGCGCGQERAKQQGVQGYNGQIARPAQPARYSLRSARRQNFPSRHEAEDDEESSQAH